MDEQELFPDYIERLENLNRHLLQALQDLPQEALDWVPGPEMNSLAVLLAHTTGSLRYWIGDVALGVPSGRDRELEFHARGLDRDEYQRRLGDVLAFVRLNLPQLELQDLSRPGHLGKDNQPVTRGWALLHALEHGYLHLGHIQITRQLWDAQDAQR